MQAWYAFLWVSYLTKIEDKNITSDKHHHMLSLLSGKRGQEISTRDCWCGGSCWCHNQVKNEFFCLFVFLCFVLLKSSTHLVVSLPGSHHKAKLVFFCLIVTITIADMLLLQAKLQADVASGQWALPSRLQVRHSCGTPASELISNHLHQNWTTYWRWPDIKIEHKKVHQLSPHWELKPC